MSIQFLNNEIFEKVRMAKKDCLTSTNISYSGVMHEISEEGKITKIYSLLPSLEDAQIVEVSSKNDKSIWMIMGELTATLKDQDLNELLSRLSLVNDLIEQGNFSDLANLSIVPEEIEVNYLTLKRISSRMEQNKLDALYKDYAKVIASLRAQQKEYFVFQSNIDQKIH